MQSIKAQDWNDRVFLQSMYVEFGFMNLIDCGRETCYAGKAEILYANFREEQNVGGCGFRMRLQSALDESRGDKPGKIDVKARKM